jgi:hypothetical protein
LVAAVSPDQRFVKDCLFRVDCEVDTVDLWFGTGPVELFELLNQLFESIDRQSQIVV